VFFHILFWIAVWFFFAYFFSYNSEDKYFVMWFSTCLLPVTMALSYFMVYFLIPKYLLTKKYLPFALYTFYAFIFTSYALVLIIYGFLVFRLTFNISAMPPMSRNFLFIFILVLLVAGLISMQFVLNQTFKTASRNKELQNKILATQLQLKQQELHYLKMQIQPHFLFNTLNTIYGLAMKQSARTPETILKLSNLLDYILYRVDKPLVNLSEEVSHIREYIELERIRFQESLKVSFSSDEISDDITIAPMLLIPFVENAFKHGTLKQGFLEIDIKITVKPDLFRISIKNSFIDSQDTEKEIKPGIGLNNIRKRLELNYPGRYVLDHKVLGDIYMVDLEINLCNNTKHGSNNTLPDS